MISHKHKVIFIHIPKCAGSSVETAFGINVNDNQLNEENLFGWDNKNKIYLQHATPQQLIDLKILSPKIWDEYYKFVIVRNSWDKSMSDFFWFKETKNFKGSFFDYVNGQNDFQRFMKKGDKMYRGDHLTPQKDYMFLNSKPINYDKIIYFDKIKLDQSLSEISEELSLPNSFFQKKVQIGKSFKKHYSKFYTNNMKKIISEKYKEDIEYFNFSFEDKKKPLDYFKLALKY